MISICFFQLPGFISFLFVQSLRVIVEDFFSLQEIQIEAEATKSILVLVEHPSLVANIVELHPQSHCISFEWDIDLQDDIGELSTGFLKAWGNLGGVDSIKQLINQTMQLLFVYLHSLLLVQEPQVELSLRRIRRNALFSTEISPGLLRSLRWFDFLLHIIILIDIVDECNFLL